MDEPETEPLTDADLERIRGWATQMVGFAGLSGHEEPLTWEQVRHWDAVSAEDGLRLVREVERLRAEARDLAEVIEEAARRLAVTDMSRGEVAAWLLSHVEGERRLVGDEGHTAMRWRGWHEEDVALGWAWRRLRQAGMSPEAVAVWLASPSGWLDGEVPEQAAADRLRRAVDAKVSTDAGGGPT